MELSDGATSEDPPDTTECPYCAETIKARAIKCRFCGSDLTAHVATSQLVGAHPPTPAAVAPESVEEAKLPFRCPKCGSSVINYQRRGFDWAATVAGAAVALVLGDPTNAATNGVVLGMKDEKQLEFKCMNCGHRDLLQKALGENGPRSIRLKNGHTIHCTLRNGTREGDWTSTYPDGSVQSRGTYVSGKVQGPIEAFHPNGSIQVRGGYSLGQREGVHEYFDEAGQLLKRTPFHNGKLEGTVELFHPSGAIQARAEYLGGKKHGLQATFDENGQLLSRNRYANDKLANPSDETLAPHGFDSTAVLAFQTSVRQVAPEALATYLVRRESPDGPCGWMLVVALPNRRGNKSLRRCQECLEEGRTLAWPVSGREIVLWFAPDKAVNREQFAGIPGAQIL